MKSGQKMKQAENKYDDYVTGELKNYNIIQLFWKYVGVAFLKLQLLSKDHLAALCLEFHIGSSDIIKTGIPCLFG